MGVDDGARTPWNRRVRPVLHVCVTCRAGLEPVEGVPVPGRRLFDALAALPDASVELREVTCLAACERGCTAAIEAPGKWRVLLGHLDAAHAADILDYARLYAASSTGMVMPSKRAATLRHAVLGRIPA